MAYSDFGLDETKQSQDASEISGKHYCPFCGSDNHSYGFSLCFSNTIICKSCLDHATNVENQHRWVADACCFKCRQHNTIAMADLNGIIEICKDCIDWGKYTMNSRRAKTLF